MRESYILLLKSADGVRMSRNSRRYPSFGLEDALSFSNRDGDVRLDSTCEGAINPTCGRHSVRISR